METIYTFYFYNKRWLFIFLSLLCSWRRFSFWYFVKPEGGVSCIRMQFLLLFVTLCSGAEIIVSCQSEEDYYRLLYSICLSSPPCKILFHLTPPTLINDTAVAVTPPEQLAYITQLGEEDFALFQYQASQYTILPLTTQNHSESVLGKVLPGVWLPNISVLIDASLTSPCALIGNIEASVALTALYAMHLYKMIISDEFFCHNPNERIFLDIETREPYCRCKTGKECESESNFNQLYTFLQIVLITLIAILILSTLGSVFYKRHLLRKNRSLVN